MTSKAPRRQPGSALRPRDRYRQALQRQFSRLLPVLSLMLLMAVIIVPAGLFVWLVLFTEVFVVQAVTVIDARDHTMQVAKDIVEQHVEQSLFNRNIFFVQSDVMEVDILAQLPQVRTVHVTRKLPGTIKVIIQEQTPALLLLSNTNYYFVNQDGVPYEEARLETLPGIVLPTVKNDDPEAVVTLGVAAVSSDFVSFLQEVQTDLPKRIGSIVSSVAQVTGQVVEIHIPSLAAREVHVVLDNNWVLLLDATRPAQDQTDILEQLLSTTISQEELLSLEYIDLRIPQRVYYKTSGSEF